jgi:MacB-like periplasmic core domain
MGADGFRIVRMAWLGPWDPKKFLQMSKRNPDIKREEYEFIKENATLLRGIGMMASKQARVSFRGDSMEGVSIQGVTANIPAINNVQVASGRDISENEVQRHASVAFIGNDIKNQYFVDRDPLGKTIQINGVPFEVLLRYLPRSPGFEAGSHRSSQRGAISGELACFPKRHGACTANDSRSQAAGFLDSAGRGDGDGDDHRRRSHSDRP